MLDALEAAALAGAASPSARTPKAGEPLPAARPKTGEPSPAAWTSAPARQPFAAWPGWAHLRYFLWLGSANALWFAFVYGGADHLTAQRTFRVPVAFPFELRIPFVPSMTLAYMSIYLLFLLAPFVLRTRRELRAAVWTLAWITFCGGVGFLLLPAQLAFPPPRQAALGGWAPLYHLATNLGLTYNLLPSLHVALSVACVAIFAPHTGGVGARGTLLRSALWSWALLIAASTLLIHRHHLLDVAAGWLLALAAVRAVYRPVT